MARGSVRGIACRCRDTLKMIRRNVRQSWTRHLEKHPKSTKNVGNVIQKRDAKNVHKVEFLWDAEFSRGEPTGEYLQFRLFVVD